ncbi:hypothetical protein N0V82_006487 [Gnomoniopsis sp. IMI 355080]|nr:hypothetical protein N0V82_006487 [Gnomoniopsis sp. IMI 355080]
MSFAPSFGSVGDFLSIAILIKDIVVALDDCRGSSSKYQGLKQGLEILGEAIRQVEHVYHDPNLVVSREAAATAMRIVSRIKQCLATFSNNKLQKYTTSLSPGGSGNTLKDAARKIQFKFGEKDIENFQREIMGYNLLLTTLMEVSTIHTIERNNDGIAKQISAIASQTKELQQATNRNLRCLINFGKKVFTRLNFLTHLTADIQRSTSQVMSLIITISSGVAELRSLMMKIEWPLRDEHFVLEDATGRAFPIPLKTVTSWELFEYILQEHFKGRTGAHRVLRRRYMLSERATSAEVDRTTNWANAFRPYQRIDMSILCKAPATQMEVERLSTCPFCGAESTSGMDTQVECHKCRMFYKRVVDLEDEDNVAAAPMLPQQQRIPQSGQPCFGPVPPQHRRKSRKREHDSENEDECIQCHRPKRSKREDDNKRKAIDEVDSGSDEENFRGLSRITLVSRRKRMKMSKKAVGEYLVSKRSDAKKWGIPTGYSLRYWDPTEEPILFLGSVFDGNSLGKWIYDWTVYNCGASTPVSEVAGELWLLVIQLTGKLRQSKEIMPRIRNVDNRDSVQGFRAVGERLIDKLKELLIICQKPMLLAAKTNKSTALGAESGTIFVDTLFGEERELEKTKEFMQCVRLWNLEFDANCGNILKRPEQ